ncbi:MAG: prepilin peptidase [Nitratireductor sp.]|nr:prepilin peptidase [Nitratireductor sp.]
MASWAVALPFFGLLLGLVAAIALIDLRELRIPDALNAALLAGGLAQAAVTDLLAQPAGHAGLRQALASAAILFAVLLAVRALYHRLRGRTGLGLGDVKMGGAAASWISPWNLNLMVLIACLSCLLYVWFARRKSPLRPPRQAQGGGRIPFGPFLGLGVVAIWLAERL